MESRTATIMVWNTLEMDSWIISLESLITVMWIPGLVTCMASICFITSLETSMAVALCCFLIPREMTSSPL